MKTLYFEGAGMDFEQNNQNQSNVLNHRIRTAFTNLVGEQIYLEMGNTYIRDWKGKSSEKMGTWVDFCFKIPPTINGYVNYHEIFSRTEEHLELAKMEYTKENLTNWINKKLNCDFDTIHVLDLFYGYRVHADNRGYNLIDNHDVNHELAAKRREAYNNIDMEYRRLLNEKYSMIGLLKMDDDSITIRCHASETAIGLIPRVKTIKIV